MFECKFTKWCKWSSILSKGVFGIVHLFVYKKAKLNIEDTSLSLF